MNANFATFQKALTDFLLIAEPAHTPMVQDFYREVITLRVTALKTVMDAATAAGIDCNSLIDSHVKKPNPDPAPTRLAEAAGVITEFHELTNAVHSNIAKLKEILTAVFTTNLYPTIDPELLRYFKALHARLTDLGFYPSAGGGTGGSTSTYTSTWTSSSTSSNP
jgi:hypothetical protein